MADPPPDSKTDGEPEVEAGREPTSDTPRWMMVIGISVILLVVVVVILLLTGGGLGGHGPSMHTS